MRVKLKIVDLGDALTETMQGAPMPMAFDNISVYGWF